MASVRLRPASKFWTACISIDLPDGRRKQKQFATGLEDREEALAVAVAAERAARRYQDEPHRLRAALEAIADDFTPQVEVDPGPWLKAWAESRKGEVAAKSLVNYRKTMDEVAQWLKGKGIKRFTGLTARACTELRDHWASRNSETTANHKIKQLRIALNAAVKEHRLADNPAAQVQQLRAAATNRREFRPTELETLLGAVQGEWRALTLLGLYTGQRMSDLATLQWRNLDLVAGTITLTAQKTGALVCLPLVPAALEAVTALPISDNPNAPVLPGIAKMASTSRSNAFRQILAGVGLAEPVPRRPIEGRATRRKTSELSFHSLRHTATSLLKSAGVTDAIARAIIGHQSEAVSRQYTHLDLDTMRAALEKIQVQ